MFDYKRMKRKQAQDYSDGIVNKAYALSNEGKRDMWMNPERGSVIETEEVINDRDPYLNSAIPFIDMGWENELEDQRVKYQRQIDAANEKLNIETALNKGHRDARKRAVLERKEQGILGNIVDGAGGMLSGVADYGKNLFTDPSRMGLLSAGLSMMDPNTYYDKDGFYSAAGGINRALGQGVGTAQTVQGSPAFKRATELMKIQEWNKSGRGKGEFANLMNIRNRLIEKDPTNPDIKTLNDRLKYLSNHDIPSNIKTFNEVSKMNPEEQKLFFDTVRANQTINQGDQEVLINQQDPTKPVATYPINPPPETLPEFKQDVAERTAIGKAIGEAKGAAFTSIPNMEMEYNQISDLSQKLVDHAGFESLIGATLTPFMRHWHGSETAGADSLRNQIEGKVFMKAYETLKGGGQITEIEGEQAKKALARMDISLKESEYVEALNEFLDAYYTGLEKMRRASGTKTGSGFRHRRITRGGGKPKGQPEMSPAEIRLEELRRKQREGK